MVEAFRTIAQNQGWEFSYGRADFHNLEELEEGKTGLYIDPIETEKLYSSTGSYLNQNSHSGRLMILVKSDLDQVYDGQKDQNESTGKWKQNIEPIKENGGVGEVLEGELICDDFEIKAWRILDVINLFDQNLDGVIVNFKIKEYK